jgi:hypothetical protein
MTMESAPSLYEQAFQERVNYSDRYSCIFIHIPKAAGTTVAHLLGLPASSHLTYRELIQTKFFQHHSQTPIFTVMRDPIARFFSLYYYARMPVSHYHNNIDPAKALYGPHTDYSLLMNASPDEAIDHLIAGRLRHDRRWNQWQPQANWILATKSDSENPRINVLRMESLAAGLQKLLQLNAVKLPHANRSSPTTSSPGLSPESTAKLQAYYSHDYDLLSNHREHSSFPSESRPGCS